LVKVTRGVFGVEMSNQFRAAIRASFANETRGIFESSDICSVIWSAISANECVEVWTGEAVNGSRRRDSAGIEPD
jgi:hypothetical protein